MKYKAMIKNKILAIALLITICAPCTVHARALWLVDLWASSANDSGRLIIGTDKSANDGFNRGYDAEAYLLSGSIMAYFYYPEWGQNSPYFWMDVKNTSLPKEWTFYISSSYTGRTIDMNWKLSDVPDTVNLYLIDSITNIPIDMKTNSSYSYNNGSTTPRIFTVKAEGYIDNPPPTEDTTPPDTLITSSPSEFVISSANIAYTGSDDVTPADMLQFSYKLDSGAWSAWSNSKSITLDGLSEGTHTFSVKAKDEAGNEDSTPAEAAFTVDTLPPILILYQPNPSELWPANGRMVDVIMSGNAQDSGSGIASLSYIVNDEYGQYNLAGNVTTGSDGSFAFNISLKADRDSKDKDGRIYLITMDAFDKAGNMTTQGVTVTVPHK